MEDGKILGQRLKLGHKLHGSCSAANKSHSFPLDSVQAVLGPTHRVPRVALESSFDCSLDHGQTRLVGSVVRVEKELDVEATFGARLDFRVLGGNPVFIGFEVDVVDAPDGEVVDPFNFGGLAVERKEAPDVELKVKGLI